MTDRDCMACNIGELIADKRMGSMVCVNCGECFELGAFSDEVAFREDGRGRYQATGSTYNVERGFAKSQFQSHRHMKVSVDNARSILRRYCDMLSIGETFAMTSSGFYQQLLVEKYMHGRRLNVVLAACLYLSIRLGNANVILLDISDIAEANVYDILRYFFQISAKLHQNVQSSDPCEYTIRFVDMLNLGDRQLHEVKKVAANIRETANRLVQQMKRDWIHFGRRPSGVCAAAVLIAARINKVSCSLKEIVSVAKVCENTVRNRINEFVDTPASALTVKKFLEMPDQTEPSDPPSFNRTRVEDIDKVEEYRKIIEEMLQESRQGTRGMYAKFIGKIFNEETQNQLELDDEENSETIGNVIVEESSLSIENFSDSIIENSSFPKASDDDYWTELRPTPESLGLGRNYRKKTSEEKFSNEENVEEIDDEEIESYIITDQEEIRRRDHEWAIIHREFLEEEERRKQSIEAGDIKVRRNKRKKSIDQDVPPSTSEAVGKALMSKNIPADMEHLKRLFNEDQ